MKKVFLFVAPSGAGKTSIVEELEKRGFKSIQSYTTRKPRYEDETGHIFCTIEEYEQFKKDNQIMAYTYFDNNHYFATKEQLLTHDLYVIDPSGIDYLKVKVNDIEFITFYIKVREIDRINRMYKRGDTQYTIGKRLVNDANKFKNITFDYAVQNNDLKKTVEIVEYIILKELDEI